MSHDALHVPPQDLEAEAAVIGAVLLRPDALTELARTLDPADFYRDAHRLIYTTALRLHDERTPVDVMTVAMALRHTELAGRIDLPSYLDRCLRTTPYSVNVAAYAAAVRDTACRRRVMEAGIIARDAALNDELTATQALDVAETALRVAAAGQPQEDTLAVRETLFRAWDRDTAARAPRIPTGLPALDHALLGGWHRPQVHVLAARTRMGKSSLVLGWASAAMDAGCKVGLLSLEMPHEEVEARLLSLRTGAPYWALDRGLHGIPREHDDWRRTAQTERDRLRAADLLAVDHCYGVTVPMMVRKLRRLREEEGCGLLVLDLLNRVQASGQSIYDRMSAVNAAVQDAAPAMGCPLLAVTQLNRSGAEGAAPTLESIKGSGDIEEASPVVMILERDLKRGPEEIPAGKLHVVKNRDGRERAGKHAIRLIGDAETWAWHDAEAAGVEPEEAEEEDIDVWG